MQGEDILSHLRVRASSRSHLYNLSVLWIQPAPFYPLAHRPSAWLYALMPYFSKHSKDGCCGSRRKARRKKAEAGDGTLWIVP